MRKIIFLVYVIGLIGCISPFVFAQEGTGSQNIGHTITWSGVAGSGGTGKVGRLRIALPYENQVDVTIDDDYIDSQNSKDRLLYLIKIVGERLRIGFMVVFMLVIIQAGYLLITGRGQEEKLEKANHILFYAGIALGIFLFAYAIIKLVVNLF